MPVVGGLWIQTLFLRKWSCLGLKKNFQRTINLQHNNTEALPSSILLISSHGGNEGNVVGPLRAPGTSCLDNDTLANWGPRFKQSSSLLLDFRGAI